MPTFRKAGRVEYPPSNVMRLILNRPMGGQDKEIFTSEGPTMLAEKFFLILETLKSNNVAPDGSQIVVSRTPHVPIKLPNPK
jgi:hypothetical protein